jgi:hypothetical protein
MTVPELPVCPFALAPIPGKGIAVIATQPIPANTLLFTESPLLLLTDESHSIPQNTRVLTAFARLPKAARVVLLSLCSNLPEEQQHTDEAVTLGVWKANNFCLDGEGTVNGLFALAARLNHSCIGGENCRWVYNHDEATMSFWTDKDVLVRVLPRKKKNSLLGWLVGRQMTPLVFGGWRFVAGSE